MIDVEIVGKKTLKGKLPESYGEMNRGQFMAAVRYVCGDMKAADMIACLLGKEFKGMHVMEWMKYELLERIRFVSEMSDACSRFFIPMLRFTDGLRFYRLYAPSDCLNGMTFLQFMSIDNFFSFYTVTKENSHLYHMVASMYLSEKTVFIAKEKGQKVVDLDKMAELVGKHCSQLDVLAIYVNWIFVKNWLTTQFKHLFAKGQSSGKKQVTDWLDVFDSFVGDHIPDMEAYQSMECMDAFRILNKKIRESKRNKQ